MTRGLLMLKCGALSIVGFFLLPLPALAQDAGFEAKVRAAGETYLAAEKGVGLSIGVLRDGRSHYYDFGTATKGGAASTRDTAYEIGSISKTISGLLLARAVIAGKASLDDDVRKYLDGAYPKLAYEGAPIRLLHLANMTSALPDNLPDLSGLDPDPGHIEHAAALAAYGKDRFLEDLRGVAPSAKPGENVAHSNVAAQLLTHVLERIYGAPYDAILKREIEGPLGFAARGEAMGYEASGAAAAVLPRDKFGYRYSTADMLRYAALQLNEADAAVALSHKGTWFTLDRKTYVGLTWIVSELPGGGRQLRYSGGTWGFASVMMLYPERKLGVVLMANNASDTAQDKLSGIATQLADALAAEGK
ncbi:beta-lactamase family protein [Sphingomonas sp. JC676]|uniref:serine hydrolase domain-containing protein n=1 Tax=Sphingomonas sp. JC676 TaxID=2768065 RepID=UPI00165784CA|nr:serine hydrolase domain-containing protein [Sphingomonas sp. JC676]MBC9033507.1 beta-lactamase family protein [Sphingomonas sp. JC676]